MNQNNILYKFKDKVIDIKDNIFPFWGNYKSNKKIITKINTIYETDIESINLSNLNCAGDLSRVPLEIVEKTYNDTLERKKTIEDKAKINVLGVTIFTSLVTALSTSIIKLYSVIGNNIIKYIVFIVGFAAIIYMLYGGILALEVLMNKNKIYLINEDEQILNKRLRKKIYGKNIDLNGYSNLIRTNYITSSYQCIRNGLYILLIIFSIGLLPLLNDNNNKQDEKLEKLNNQILELKYKLQYSESLLVDKGKEVETIKENISKLQEENDLLNKRFEKHNDRKNMKR